MRADGLLEGERRSPVCNMLLSDGGELVGGVADFSALEALGADEVLFLSSFGFGRGVAADREVRFLRSCGNICRS